MRLVISKSESTSVVVLDSPFATIVADSSKEAAYTLTNLLEKQDPYLTGIIHDDSEDFWAHWLEGYATDFDWTVTFGK